MQDKPDLAALIASRICHDLISPLGAIGNGVELLAMEPGGTRPEMALISESVANANARIRFFRICFGQASSDQRISWMVTPPAGVRPSPRMTMAPPSGLPASLSTPPVASIQTCSHRCRRRS